ncbi:hypothetical protein DFH06DRAFT_1309620 [Mycena polygramma]|nr:hypothetical protein DFH06DRAFT_1309620 [Mycena polygramma]
MIAVLAHEQPYNTRHPPTADLNHQLEAYKSPSPSDRVVRSEMAISAAPLRGKRLYTLLLSHRNSYRVFMSGLDPDLPPQLQDGPTSWKSTLAAFVNDLFVHELPHGRTAHQLLALFDTPENLRVDSPEFFYYYACDNLLCATRRHREAGGHIALIAELFGLLRAEGFKRDPDQDDSDAVFTMMTIIIGPTLREFGHDKPVAPGYRYNDLFALERDPEYVPGVSFQADLAEYARKYEGQIRFWSLVGRLEADGLFGTDLRGVGTWPLLCHQKLSLLAALEDPMKRGTWETLWAAVLQCDEEMAYGDWGNSEYYVERLAGFKDAARKIAGDDRAPLLWRARFALMLEGLEGE